MTVRCESPSLRRDPEAECARLLEQAARHLRSGRTSAALVDLDGVVVGDFALDGRRPC